MIKKNKTPNVLTHKRGKGKSSKHSYSNASSTQRARIIDWFNNTKPRLSTTEARQKLGIMSPASRILELRRLGFDISLLWSNQVDANGVPHRAGEYVYFGNKGGN
jgi:hypothetical protein